MKSRIKDLVKNNMFLLNIVLRLQRIGTKFKKSVIGKGNKIKNRGVSINVKYDIIGNHNHIIIKHGAIMSNITIFIRGDHHQLIIGENVQFSGGSVWFEDEHCTIEIGNGTTIESAHLAITEPNKKITIGEDCMFSSNIEFRTGDSHSILDNVTKKRINYAQNIKVGNHVWIGAHSIILKGIEIGDNSIIGTSSLVTKNIPSNVIAGGLPAKVLKNNIDWVRERIYEGK
ncbi:acyltransferase [Arenibacter sp. BSSL-BM3]|uniref:Acyltransferase n=1 Tax=Arenibacter arenosicollis TaxID=2762274 RepID=A0ABR7QLE8_9FLAO|nr:acyltransferase [Arenibacter arenosicollis]MBC8767869.1 acyltransferase [Arenibacter arenosicollis]